MTKRSAGPDPSNLKQTQSTDHPPLTILSTLPKLSHLPVFCHPHSTFYPFRPFPLSQQRTALCNQPIFMQNKPNSQKSEIAISSYNTWTYRNTPPPKLEKNKPKQSQFTPAKPIPTQYAIRTTPAPWGKNKPNLSRRSRNPPSTRYAIRTAQYAIRHTNRKPVQSAKMAQRIASGRIERKPRKHVSTVIIGT